MTPPHEIPVVPPRRRETELGTPTAEPQRSEFEVRDGAPDPESVERPGVSQHWRKHPSDYHADCAHSSMTKSLLEADTRTRDHHMRVAEVHALLSLRDAVLEAAATVKEIARPLMDDLARRAA